MGSVGVEFCKKADATALLSAAYAVSLKLKISNVASITAKETKSLMIVSCFELVNRLSQRFDFVIHYRLQSADLRGLTKSVFAPTDLPGT